MKKVISVLMACIIVVVMTTSVGAVPCFAEQSCICAKSPFYEVNSSEHINPNTGGRCSNTYRSIVHLSSQRGVQMSGHIISDGRYCTIYCIEHLHDVYCSSCGYYFGNTYKYCNTSHTICPISMLTCY